jgi:hypothetical protein
MLLESTNDVVHQDITYFKMRFIWKILYDITEYEIHGKILGVSRMYTNESYNSVCVGRHLTNIFHSTTV